MYGIRSLVLSAWCLQDLVLFDTYESIYSIVDIVCGLDFFEQQFVKTWLKYILMKFQHDIEKTTHISTT